jgi:histidyl-tRNA synthetase
VAQLGGRATPASGWALGLERVVELLEAEECVVPEQAPHAYFVAVGELARLRAFGVAETLRERVGGLRLSVDCVGGSLKAQLRRADKSGARLALILGEDELTREAISVKPLRSDAPQTMLTVEALAAELLRETVQSA